MNKENLERVVVALCPFIEGKIYANKKHDWSEYELRKEVVSCILGSQVRYETAINTLERIDKAGLLDDDVWSNRRFDIEKELYAVLSGEKYSSEKVSSYRFPRLRAAQLSGCRKQLLQSKLSIKEIVYNKNDDRVVRSELVKLLPGLGPKQASMFMRNVNRSFDLAILDTHVLRFMNLQKLIPQKYNHIGSLRLYERIEEIMRKYAQSIGFPVGYLDWAIWATVRAAMEMGI